MPTTPTFPSIPLPREDIKSILEACLTMKRILEMLTGQDQGETYANHVFVQPETPEALHTGDLWLCTSKVPTFNIWSGDAWARIANVTAITEDVDLLLGQFSNRRVR